MKSSAWITVMSVAAGLALTGLGGREVSAGEAANTLVARPAKAASVDLGSKHAVGYFRADRGVCLVTLVVGDKPASEDAVVGAGARLVLAVKPGKYASYEAENGKSLEIGCTPAAAAMTLKTVDKQRG